MAALCCSIVFFADSNYVGEAIEAEESFEFVGIRSRNNRVHYRYTEQWQLRGDSPPVGHGVN